MNIQDLESFFGGKRNILDGALESSKIQSFSTLFEGSSAALNGKYQGLILVGMNRAASFQ